jgi:hypothetical protein
MKVVLLCYSLIGKITLDFKNIEPGLFSPYFNYSKKIKLQASYIHMLIWDFHVK